MVRFPVYLKMAVFTHKLDWQVTERLYRLFAHWLAVLTVHILAGLPGHRTTVQAIRRQAVLTVHTLAGLVMCVVVECVCVAVVTV